MTLNFVDAKVGLPLVRSQNLGRAEGQHESKS